MIVPTFSVSECIAAINQTLEVAYGGVIVEGEVASYTVNQGKFVFFDLKDDTGTLQCFSMVWQMRTPLENGMRVAVQAVPKLTQKGRFSLTVQSVKPLGEGSIARAFDLLKKKLDAEGLFAPEKKRLLPELPERIAVISSTSAAGYGDFIKILENRWSGLAIDVAHVQVQGEGAEKQIIRALDFFNQRAEGYDVIVLLRGGGSADDLQTFNDEGLVRAIVASRVPVLTGIGHEQDVTLADLAADRRASTPSNAAEILVPDRREIFAKLQANIDRAYETTTARYQEAIDGLRGTLLSALEVAEGRIDEQEQRIAHAKEVLDAYNPASVLRRGYAIVRGSVQAGNLIEIETKRQLIEAEVRRVSDKKHQ